MISEAHLQTLINSLQGAAHARTTDQGQYFMANQKHANNHGFSSIEASIGINYAEMRQHRREQLLALKGSLILEEKHVACIEKLNWQADHAKEPVSSAVCTLFPTGNIHAGLLNKIPILNDQRTTVAVLTFFEDKTSTIPLATLYAFYKKHYPMHQAIIQFLRYLKIAKYFSKIPTNQELTILLMLRQNSASKYVAKAMQINYRTVEEYKARLRNKLTAISLEQLLVILRLPRGRTFTDTNNFGANMEIMA